MTSYYNPSSLYVAPTLVIGLGGTGVEVVRLTKERVRHSMNPLPEIIEFLTVDTELLVNPPGQERIYPREFAYLGDYNATWVLKHLDMHPHIKDWWYDEADVVQGSIYKGARQRRCVGRLSLYTRWGNFAQMLDAKATPIREIVRKEKLQKREVEVERSKFVQVYIVSSVCGGTGSGILIDVAFRVRELFGDDADIVGIFLLPSCFLPEMQSHKQKQRIQANAYATLREINHFMCGKPFEACFPDNPFADNDGKKNSHILYRPYDLIHMVDRSNGKEFISSLDQVRRMAAQQIFLDILTPLGKRIAARRNNVRDLAGEKIFINGKEKPQALAISSFATASLVLPNFYTSMNSHTAEFIQRRVIGAIKTRRERENDLKALFQKIDKDLSFEKVETKTTINQTDGLFGDLFGEESETVGASIDISDSKYVIQSVYNQLVQELNMDFERDSLRGVANSCQVLLDVIQSRLAELAKEDDGLQQEIGQLSDEISKNQRRTVGPVRTFYYWVEGLFSSGVTAASKRQAEIDRQVAQISQTKSIKENLLNRNKKREEVYTNLQIDMLAIQRELEQRIKGFEKAVDEIEVHITKPNNGSPNEREALGVFELATEVGNDEYWVGGNGNVSKQLLRQAFIDSITSYVSKPRDQDEQDLLAKLKAAGIFNVRAVYGEKDKCSLDVVEYPEYVGLSDYIKTVQDEFVRLLQGHRPRMINYLEWFYRNVRYDTKGASRYTPIDPLEMLRHRCEMPFLEVELSTEQHMNTEDVRLAGVDAERAEDSVVEDILANLDTFEDVKTGVPERLDLSLTRFGFSINALKNIKNYQEAYKQFKDIEKDKSIHPHRDWPNGMDELVENEDQ